jgi:transposase
MLLPPDLRDWVGEDDLVHFVIQAVDRLPFDKFHLNVKGCGDAQFPPHMMMALLIYSYANGIFSSRRIERATYRDVGVRYLTADTHPDHDTICTFRRKNLHAVSEAFVDVLELARELGLVKLGRVSVDGTHIKANASKDKNVTYERACELREQLGLDIAQLLQEAEQADANDSDPQKLPEEIARREKLLAKMDRACETLEERARQRAEKERVEYEKKLATREKRPPCKKGPPPKAPSDTPRAKEQINLSDSDSNLMRKNKREGYTQSFNAQAVVDAEGSQLVVGQRVSQSASDGGELEADLQSIPKTMGKPGQVLADCGYMDAAMFERLEAEGIDPLVSVHREDAHSERRYEFRPPKNKKPIKNITDPRLLAMRAKLQTEEGKKIYKLRAQTVEPVFGVIKQVLGFRQFLLRGVEKVSGEWGLVCLAYNLKRLHVLKANR